MVNLNAILISTDCYRYSMKSSSFLNRYHWNLIVLSSWMVALSAVVLYVRYWHSMRLLVLSTQAVTFHCFLIGYLLTCAITSFTDRAFLVNWSHWNFSSNIQYGFTIQQNSLISSPIGQIHVEPEAFLNLIWKNYLHSFSC